MKVGRNGRKCHGREYLTALTRRRCVLVRWIIQTLRRTTIRHPQSVVECCVDYDSERFSRLSHLYRPTCWDQSQTFELLWISSKRKEKSLLRVQYENYIVAISWKKEALETVNFIDSSLSHLRKVTSRLRTSAYEFNSLPMPFFFSFMSSYFFTVIKRIFLSFLPYWSHTNWKESIEK